MTGITADQFEVREQNITRLAGRFELLREAVAQTVVGQQPLVDALIMALLCPGTPSIST